jgi:type IV fimbrial biogenesis protein FimT
MRTRCRRERGFTLVELMVTLAVAAVLAMLAAPSFSAMFVNLRVQGMASELAADLQYARSEAVRRRAAVELASDGDGGGYTIRSGGATLKSVRFASGMAIDTDASVTYSALRALSGESAFTLTGNGGTSLRVNTNGLGRVSLCSPSGAVKGYASC